MLQDIPAALRDPRDDIFDDALLAPPPLLAAPAALLAVLVLCQGYSPVDPMIKYLLVVFIELCSLMSEERRCGDRVQEGGNTLDVQNKRKNISKKNYLNIIEGMGIFINMQLGKYAGAGSRQ